MSLDEILELERRHLSQQARCDRLKAEFDLIQDQISFAAKWVAEIQRIALLSAFYMAFNPNIGRERERKRAKAD